MNDFNNATLLSSAERAVVPREQTQAILDLRAAASARIKPADRYTLADRLEEQAQRHGERPFII
ncbi:MAG: long-chain-acyl-CoA synthetase, partial [Pseudomonas sp.]|nr:long-chain-acyl-CoA synthetase [Pseudomonas sp.]